MTTSLDVVSAQNERSEKHTPSPSMAWIPGGNFQMGSDVHYPEEAPVHRVTVDGFWIDRCAVTNADFARFVAETGYITAVERVPRAEDYPGAKTEMLVAGSAVFEQPTGCVDLNNFYSWWAYVPGADWRHPLGPQSSIGDKANHPVVQVSFEDTEAYAAWAGKSLPTEAEWEFAARGGLDGAEFAWGSELKPGGKSMANIWYGEFPHQDLSPNGRAGTVPVASYPPNGFGLFDMIGNCWEWTSDWFQDHARAAGDCCGSSNPRGGPRETSCDPRDPLSIPRRVMKGGSYLCARNYCQRYRPAARLAQPTDNATCHSGFRCIVRPRG